MSIEQKLKDLIISRYDNIYTFTKSIGIPNSTFASIMQRGIMNSNVGSLFKICKSLDLSMDKLCEGEIVFLSDLPEPDPLSVNSRIDALCTDLHTQKNITVDGSQISEKRAADIATLLQLILIYFKTSSE